MNLRMPAEWEGQEAVWLAWPHNKEDWPGKFAPIPWAYAEIVRHLAQVGRVRIVIKSLGQEEQAMDMLGRSGISRDQIDFLEARTDRVWLRDSGPTFVYDGKTRAALDWRFNAWAKYDNWKNDDKIPALAAQALGIPAIQPEHKGRRVVLEGGAIDVNGKGVLLTTEECLISKVQCRNPGFTREDYEEVFGKYLGISNVVWLGQGIEGDDTHGHVDDLARFVSPNTIVIASEKDKNDANFARLRDNRKRLKAARDASGKPFTVVDLPMPKPVVFEGQRLPASYANFLIANKLVLVPTFNDANDRVALAILSELMPRHEIIGIHCLDFVWGLGTLHCATQQEPADFD